MAGTGIRYRVKRSRKEPLCRCRGCNIRPADEDGFRRRFRCIADEFLSQDEDEDTLPGDAVLLQRETCSEKKRRRVVMEGEVLNSERAAAVTEERWYNER